MKTTRPLTSTLSVTTVALLLRNPPTCTEAHLCGAWTALDAGDAVAARASLAGARAGLSAVGPRRRADAVREVANLELAIVAA